MFVEQLYSCFLESSGVTTDSRNVSKGNMYFALKGERYDGHQFVIQALENGCDKAVIDNRDFSVPGRTILVDNVFDSLLQLSAHHRNQFDIPVLAITGSNGKTTTKELIREVLSSGYNTLATYGNLNNHIGVPLTLLNLKDFHEFAVIEMGANHQGEIDLLCRTAAPTHGLITNAGTAHLEGFGSPEGVLRAKSELFIYLKNTGGIIFLNSNRPNLQKVVNDLDTRHESFGSGEGDFVTGRLIDSGERLTIEVKLKKNGECLTINTKLAGDYNFENALAAVCVGFWFGIPGSEIKTAIENYIPGNNRSQIIETFGNKILMDAYNANPDSMKAAINNFLTIPGENKSVIIGDMLELGEYAAEEHRKIVKILTGSGFREVFLVGHEFYRTPVPDDFIMFKSISGLSDWLRDNPLRGRFILLKGSRGIELEKCLPAL